MPGLVLGTYYSVTLVELVRQFESHVEIFNRDVKEIRDVSTLSMEESSINLKNTPTPTSSDPLGV